MRFAKAAFALAFLGRSPWTMSIAGGIDLLLGALFLVSWFRLGKV